MISINYHSKRDFSASSSPLLFPLRSLLLFVMLLIALSAQAAYSAQVELIWDPPDGVPSTELAGYRVYYGTESRNYSHTVDVGTLTDYIVANLDSGSTYYFAVTTLGTDGAESDFSNEASKAFVQQYALTVTTVGTGAGTVTSSPSGISCPSSCTGNYKGGTVVTLTATPSSGSTFSGWSGGACSGAGICSISVNSNMSVTANFSSATTTTYSISGKVKLGARGAISGVTMTLGGASSKVATSDSQGNYNFSGLASGTYTVTPAKTGYSFTPVSASVTVSGADVTGQNFNGNTLPTYSVSGKITVGSKTFSGVTVTLGGASSGVTSTDKRGNYTFKGLAGGTYTVTPAKTGYSFTPVSRSVTVGNQSVSNQNFTATLVSASGTVSGSSITAQNFSGNTLPTYSVSGKITLGTTAFLGVTVILDGASSGVATTDSQGNYTFKGLAGGTYTVTPAKTGYSFTPVSRSVTVEYQSVLNQNFTAK